MHEFIESPDDVLALRISGTVTGDDLEPIMDRIEAIMAKHHKIHVFVETQGIDGLRLSAMPHYLNRAFPLFGKLGRFGRVAVVADQAWLRIATSLESAILPNISYRVFEPAQRAEALDWALGRQDVAA
jgi:hypothetical protein